MYSIAFPKMFTNNNTNLVKDYQATLSNLKMLLYSDKYGLLGDPYYGTNIKRMLFNQSGAFIDQEDVPLREIFIDDIYTAICIFMPQIKVDRNNIDIVQTKTKAYAAILCTNLVDKTTNLYNINLTSTD